MTLSHKLLVAALATGIVCFLETKMLFSTTNGLLPDTQNTLSVGLKHESDGFTGNPAQPKNTSTDPSMARGSFLHQTKSNQRLQANSDMPNSAKHEDLAEASQVSPFRKFRKFSFPLSHPLEDPKPPASLVWIDGLTAEQDSAIQQLAEEFKQNLQAPSGQSSSEDYARAYQDEAKINEIRFQTRYGDQLWMRHHVAAHHLNSGEPPAK